MKRILTVCALCLLTACKTTVVTPEERELPVDAKPVVPVQQVVEEPVVDELAEELVDIEDAMQEPLDDVLDEDWEDSLEDLDPESEDTNDTEQAPVASIWTADTPSSFIAFTGTKGNAVSHEGKFNDFDMTLTFDESAPGDVESASMALEIDISSMETDSGGLTDHLLNEDYFDEPTYPTASFTSTAITKLSDTIHSLL